MMARDGRAYLVSTRAQIATAIACLQRLSGRIDLFVRKYKAKLTADDRRRYITAMKLLQERIDRAEKIDVRLAIRAEV